MRRHRKVHRNWIISVLHVLPRLFSIHELVKHEENGLIFRDSQELAEQLKVRMWLNKDHMNHQVGLLFL